MPGRGRARWTTKARIQHVLSVLPAGHRLNYLLQRHVTGGFPISDAKLADVIDATRAHLAAWHRHAKATDGTPRFFEFGAGWDLGMPLTLHALGVEAQTLVDIRPLVRAELVDDIAARLRTRAADEGFDRTPPPRGGRELGTYLADLGIEYLAPCDARATGLPSGSMACITSTNTMEHIGETDLRRILAECRRLLAPGGCASFTIDYEDHYAKFDDEISVYNFLTYDERSWKRYNSDLHHQNRLRHADHRRLLLEAGFSIIEDEPLVPSAEQMSALRTISLAAPWADQPDHEVGITGARFTLAAGGAT